RIPKQENRATRPIPLARFFFSSRLGRRIPIRRHWAIAIRHWPDPSGYCLFPNAHCLPRMADYFQTIVDTEVRADEADHLARHVVTLLAGRGVIRSNPSDEGGYDRGPNAKDISVGETGAASSGHEALPPVHSHLQVLIGRMTHSDDLSEFRVPQARCPRCGELQEDDDEWQTTVQHWNGS